MPIPSRTSELKRIDDVARLLNQVVDVGVDARHADELIDEISQLLFAVSSLDPNAMAMLQTSTYLSGLALETPAAATPDGASA